MFLQGFNAEFARLRQLSVSSAVGTIPKQPVMEDRQPNSTRTGNNNIQNIHVTL